MTSQRDTHERTPPRVTVWNEYAHERRSERVRQIYPAGIHAVIRDGLAAHGIEARVATQDEPRNGLPKALLDDTDVLFWWGHIAHDDVLDEVVDDVVRRVHEGMGLVVLHSGHFSKPFRRLMGTTCDLKWREAGERERIWTVLPGHPIATGLPESFVVPQAEMYGEHFDIPQPDELVFVSWFEGGNVFRSGCCFRRGNGRIFYFRPGHETYPIYEQSEIRLVLANAARWAAPEPTARPTYGHEPIPLEPLRASDAPREDE